MQLNRDNQALHASIWGTSGSGKSKLLQSIFLQHLQLGQGVGLIEPHHDLSFDCLSSLVASGAFQDAQKGTGLLDRLIYIDWASGYVPFNVLAVHGSPQTVARNALEAMCRVWPELRSAPTFQVLFLSALTVLIANKLPITCLYQLLTDEAFRASCMARVNDPLVHQSFETFAKLGRDQTQEAGSTLRRAFLLSFSPELRLTMGQPECWLDFRQILDSGRSFIINLGNVKDAETRRLIGAMLLVQIEQAALSRSDLEPAKRTPCTLLIDEWPAFCAQDDTIGTILSQCRKYNLRLYLAAQSLAQISSDRLAGALENCKLTVAFGLGRGSAETQARHIGWTDPSLIRQLPERVTVSRSRSKDERGERETEGESTSAGVQFVPVTEQFETWTQELQNLDARMCYVKVGNSPAQKIKTLKVPELDAHPIMLEGVLSLYRKRYQRTREEAEAAISGSAVPVSLLPSERSPSLPEFIPSSD